MLEQVGLVQVVSPLFKVLENGTMPPALVRFDAQIKVKIGVPVKSAAFDVTMNSSAGPLWATLPGSGNV